MNHRRTSPLVALVPVAALVAGGVLGLVLRDAGGDGNGAGATLVSGPMPTGSGLDALAPSRPLPAAADPALVDPASVVGFVAEPTVSVPRGAAMSLSAGPDGQPAVIDPYSGAPAAERTPTPFVTDPDPTADLGAPAAPPSTQPPDPSVDTTTAGTPRFVDPCIATLGDCTGAAGTVRDAPSDGAPRLAPLQVSYPFAASGGFSATCDTIEGGAVPDPLLSAATRPTIALLVNQPASVALSGTWSDGTPFEKTTMLTLPANDTTWQQQWEQQGEQGHLLACLTLPLDTVREHASAGRANLTVDVLAISANGRATTSGALTLAVPLDGEDVPFVDALAVTGSGEVPLGDGTLASAVHVHYAVDTAQLTPTGGSFDPVTVRAYAQHAFLENADCSGWAVNRQGTDRTARAATALRNEQRTIAGRSRAVTVVDSDVFLDPTLRGGWEGYVCVRLFARDADGTTATIALRGMPVRSPRTAVYQVGAAVVDGTLPDGWQLRAAWSGADGTAWCGPVTLDPGATCTTYARLAPAGITVSFAPVDEAGRTLPALAVSVPVNTAYCDPDDPTAAVADGCNTGFSQRFQVPLGGDAGAATVSLVVLRTAAPGSLLTNPSYAWRVDAAQAFRS